MLLAPRLTRCQEPLPSPEVTSPGSGPVSHQAGGLVESSLLSSKKCQKVFCVGEERQPETGKQGGGAGALVLRHFTRGKERCFSSLL